MTGFTSRVVLAFAALLAAAPVAFAQNEIGASNLGLKKAYVKADRVALAPTTTPQAAFTPTLISCPGNGDCMVQVTVSAIVGEVLEGQGVFVKMTIDGQRTMPSLFDDVPLVEAWITPSEYSTSRSFSWLKEVTPGTHEVRVEIYGSSNNGLVFGRTLSISVLK